MLFTTAQKVAKHLGYFCYKICCQGIKTIAQPGHTGHDANFILLLKEGLSYLRFIFHLFKHQNNQGTTQCPVLAFELTNSCLLGNSLG